MDWATGFLKRIAYLDVAILATGFVLRAIAGAAIIDAYISPWLLICTFTLSMFLAFCKRHHEMMVAAESRVALKNYHPALLKGCIFFAAFASFAEYFAYTVTSKMGQRFPYLWLTSAFVAFGIARYLVLAFRRLRKGAKAIAQGEEKVVINEKYLIGDLKAT